MTPKVSVIVPVYNTEAFLKKCLDSILNQTLKEFEIIIVNDGSTDNSQRIIDEYANKYPKKIISITKPNGGLSDARNFGIKKAKGEFLSFVDSDDWIAEEMLEEMYSLAIKHNAETIICDLVKVNEKGKEFRHLPQSPQLPEKIILEEDFTIFGEMSCFACNKLFKKDLFKNHSFKKGIHFEDIELIPKLVLECKILAKINKPFYKYFERQGSITKNHTIKGLDMFIAINSVTESFKVSNYKHLSKELERFQILQGFYSYLAYVVFVKERKIKKSMIHSLAKFIEENNISKQNIKNYIRFKKVYLESLPLKKKIYFRLGIFNLKILNLI